MVLVVLSPRNETQSVLNWFDVFVVASSFRFGYWNRKQAEHLHTQEKNNERNTKIFGQTELYKKEKFEKQMYLRVFGSYQSTKATRNDNIT